ncbi:unnamed protein product, partial [Ilex paraguariensis]
EPSVVEEGENEETSPTMEIDNLVVQVSTNEDGIESVEDIQDAYDQLCEQLVKQ